MTLVVAVQWNNFTLVNPLRYISGYVPASHEFNVLQQAEMKLYTTLQEKDDDHYRHKI